MRLRATAGAGETADLGLRAGLSEAALERLGRPVVILDAEGRARFVTEAAARVAARCAGKTAGSGAKLPSAVARLLTSAVRRRRLPEAARDAEGSLQIATPGGTLRVNLMHLPPEGWLALLDDREPAAPAGPPITPRESDVLRLVAQGMSNKEVGAELGISPRTVEKHLENVRTTLGVNNRTAAALRAVQRSLEIAD